MTPKELRNEVVRSYLTRKGKNSYTQGVDRRYFYGKPTDGKPGWSDCSSSWRETYKRITGIDIGGNTAAQIVNKKLIEVCLHTKGQPDESKMLPGDLLYFKGSDASRPFGVGHVEGYIGNGQIAGHGSGTGPRVTTMKSYCSSRYSSGRGLIKVLRVITGDTVTVPTSPTIPTNTTNSYPLNFGKRELKFGMSGKNYDHDVQYLQRALITLGFSCGKWGADDDFGSSTKDAVKAYQTSRKLTVDGIVGSKTRIALEKDLPETGDSSTEASDPVVTSKKIMVQGGDAYIRTQPNTNGAILGVAKDKSVYLSADIDPSNGWVAIKHNADIGWISGKYASNI